MRQHSGAPAPKRNRRITRRIFPPDSEKSSGNETTAQPHQQSYTSSVPRNFTPSRSFSGL